MYDRRDVNPRALAVSVFVVRLLLAYQYQVLFNKSAPADNSSNHLTNVTLDWSDSNGAIDYSYCYDTTDDNTCSNWTSTGTTSQASLNGLHTNTTYYWQVRATNIGGIVYANNNEINFWTFSTGNGEIIPGEMVLIPAGDFQMGCDPDHNGGYLEYFI